MKKFLLLLSVLTGQFLSAQITITNADMPVSGDTIRISTGAAFTGMNASATDTNYTWDFSGLTAVTQTIDTFLKVSNTNLAFIFYFNQFGNHPSNLAERGTSFSPYPGLSFEDVFNFYHN